MCFDGGLIILIWTRLIHAGCRSKATVGPSLVVAIVTRLTWDAYLSSIPNQSGDLILGEACLTEEWSLRLGIIGLSNPNP